MKIKFLLIIIVCFSIFLNADELNNDVLSILRKYPTDGTHQYYWPSGGGWLGVTRDLNYRDSLFTQGDTFKRCYCCGITFEVFFFAYKSYCDRKGIPFVINNFDHAKLRNFVRQWFGSDGNRKTLLNAVLSNNLGQEISLYSAKPGDFVQLWRYNGSGHSVIFIDWVKNNSGNVIGMKYWSTQKTTNGIGYNIEYFGGSYGIKPEETYVARVYPK